MKRNSAVVKQGIAWLASYLIGKLGFTLLEQPRYEWEDEYTLTVHFRANEFYYSNPELSEDFYYNVEAYLEQLPENYYPKEMQFGTDMGEKGYASFTLSYRED